MIKNDTIELEIEKNVYEGFGLSRYEGKAVFIAGVIKGDIVEAKIIKENKRFIKAKCVKILKNSKYRIPPVCPLSAPCGGCGFCFAKYEYLLEMKEDIVKEIFSSFENLQIKSIKHCPPVLNYRHKAQYPVSETKNSKRLLIGYYKNNTHEIVNSKFCPMQPEIFDKIIDFIRNNWKLGAYNEAMHKGILRHINLRQSSYDKTILLTCVLNLSNEDFLNKKENLIEFANLIAREFPQIKGIYADLNNKKTNKITSGNHILLFGQDFIFEKLEDKTYKIGTESFFQINPKCAEILFKSARELIKNEGSILDLYGGVGTIGIFMKDAARKITLIEENAEAVKFAKENYKINNVQKYEVFEGSAELKIKEFLKENKQFANVILDPPRKGSDITTLQAVSKMTNSIIYISCNPETLKRDAEILLKEGFEFKSVEPFDMFPYTYHIELLAFFEKRK